MRVTTTLKVTAGASSGNVTCQKDCQPLAPSICAASLSSRGTAHDAEAGFAWLLHAAEAGDIDGMDNVAGAYRDGFGVAQNAEEADRWTARAAAARRNSGG